jgi:hypothetical protein
VRALVFTLLASFGESFDFLTQIAKVIRVYG